MSKIAVVYWSGTGNTEAMADLVANAAQSAGATVDKMTSAEFNAADAANYDGFALGCPAMGAEVLEESEFEPFFTELESRLGGKKVALFGSYGWGDGEWMRSWEERCREDGIQLVQESVICCGAPDADGLDSCRALGRALGA